MSRQWERMVEKNRKTVNKQRIKQGGGKISEVGREPVQIFQGRSWILPMTFVGFGLFSWILITGIGSGTYRGDALTHYTYISYICLGLFIYFLRRPTLRVTKTALSSRRFTGDKWVEAKEIEEISIFPGHIFIQFNSKRARWAFSNFLHRFEIEAMAECLREFATHNEIKLKEQREGEIRA